MRLTLLTFLLFLSCFPILKADGIKFFENRGQWEDKVRFRAELPGGAVFTENDRLTYIFSDAKSGHSGHGQEAEEERQVSDEPLRMHAFQMRFLGSTGATDIEGTEKLTEYNNYFLGDDRSKWAGNVPGFRQLEYGEVYPGIDFKLYSLDNNLKYDLVVSPGTDPKWIQLQYSHLDNIYISDGQLNMVSSVNRIVEQRPYAYQMIGGKKVKVDCEFTLTDATVGFILGDYDNSFPLVIDPELIFSTYTGSFADNWGFSATYDTLGNAYAAGIVRGNASYPTVFGSYDLGFNGGEWDIVISKFNPTGTQLIYSTYLGGNSNETPTSIVVSEATQELVMLGTTSSANFPRTVGPLFGGSTTFPVSTGSVGIDYPNSSDLVLTRFTASGGALVNSRFIGGSQIDGINTSARLGGAGSYAFPLVWNYGDVFRGDVYIDASENVFIVSNTNSPDFPATNVLSPFGSGQDAVIVKLTPTLSNVVWSTRLGGNFDDAAYSVKVDFFGNVYVAGGTGGSQINTSAANTFPITFGAFNPNYGGKVDGFVTKLNPSGNVVLASTYVGTAEYDQAFFLDINSNAVFLFGQTKGAYTQSPGLYSSNAVTGQFIQRLPLDLTNVQAKSIVFGNQQDRTNIVPTAFAVSDCGPIFLSGWGGGLGTGSGLPHTGDGGNVQGLPITADAFQSTTDNGDFYFAVFENNLSALQYATYFGSNDPLGRKDHVDGGTSRFDPSGIIYQAICASCGPGPPIPTTPGAVSSINRSDNCNMAVVKFDFSNLIGEFLLTDAQGLPLDTSGICTPALITTQNQSVNATSYQWDFGDGNTSTQANPTHVYVNPGLYNVRLIAINPSTCKVRDTVFNKVNVIPSPFVILRDTLICEGNSVELSFVSDANQFFWGPGITDPLNPNPIVIPETTTSYGITVTNEFQCSATGEVYVKVADTPDLMATVSPDKSYVPFYIQATVRSDSVTNIFWDLGNGQTATGKVANAYYVNPGIYTIYVSGEFGPNACPLADTLQVEGFPFLIPNVVTPNGDGLNDYFNLEAKLTAFSVKIFNRWGKQVYEADRYRNEWPESPESGGIYYYQLTDKGSGHTYKGWIQVMK